MVSVSPSSLLSGNCHPELQVATERDRVGLIRHIGKIGLGFNSTYSGSASSSLNATLILKLLPRLVVNLSDSVFLIVPREHSNML